MKLNINKHLEIVITKKSGRIIASSPSFPKSKGIGKTEEEAVTKLVAAISRFISKSAKSALDSIFDSGNYTEIVLDNSKKKKIQRKIYNIDSSNASSQKNITFKYDQPEELLNLYGKEPENDINQFLDLATVSALESRINNSPFSQSPQNKNTYELPPEGNPESFMFGIMLSLN